MPSIRRSRLTRLAMFAFVGSILVACAAGGAPGGLTGGLQEVPGGGEPAVAAPPGRVQGGGTGVVVQPDKSGGSGSGQGDDLGAPVDDARIVRTGTMELEVSDVTAAVGAARDGIRAMGGYIGASTTAEGGGHPIATITYRVPVDRWEDALALLRSLGGRTTKVVSEQTQAVEVTGSIVDLEARIRNLRASETALQGIAERATRVSDILEVQAQLTSVRGDIESLTAQLAELEDRADLATLAVTFRVPVVAVEVARKEWDPTVVVDEAVASLLGMGQGLATAGIWLAIVWLPILVVLGVLVLGAAWIARRTGMGRARGPRDGTGVAPSGA